MKIEWVEGFEISVNTCNKEVTISANREGLLSLPASLKHLLREHQAIIFTMMNITLLRKDRQK